MWTIIFGAKLKCSISSGGKTGCFYEISSVSCHINFCKSGLNLEILFLKKMFFRKKNYKSLKA